MRALLHFGRVASLALAAVWLSAAVNAEETASAGHLFILSGQSNMTGNLENGFRETVEARLGAAQVMIVRSMKSGRGIRFWVPDYAKLEGGALDGEKSVLKSNSNGEEYPVLLAAVKKAGDATRFQTVTFVWMQGESDAANGLSGAYAAAFRNLRQRLMDDLGIKTMHVVIGRISDYGLQGEKADGWKSVRATQEQLAKDLEHAAWVDTDDLNDIDGKPQGDLHYPKEPSVVLGRRLAEQAIRLIGQR